MREGCEAIIENEFSRKMVGHQFGGMLWWLVVMRLSAYMKKKMHVNGRFLFFFNHQ